MHHRSEVQCPGFTRHDQSHPCIGNGIKHWEAARCTQCAHQQRFRRTNPSNKPVHSLAEDRVEKQRKFDLTQLRANYAEALKTIEQLERIQGAIDSLKNSVETFTIQPLKGKHSSEGTAVIVASDWHVEERVGNEVGGLNIFNPEIAQQRATRFFQAGLRLVQLLQQDITINTVILALLGDFITNDIHGAENAEMNSEHPNHAIVTAQNLLISGIEFLLNNSKVKLIIPCHSGNHARTTQTTRFGSENGHSLEYLMYRHLAAYFRNEPRITFLIAEGMHSYIDVYGQIIRFQHGHAIKYGGGVGGIFIPANKAIAQWDKGRRADLNVFGHFHQMKDGGNFLCNGSLIGYGSYALSIKADFEEPRQLLFLMDKRRKRTCTWPILLTD